jgi:hypothetical protein
MSGEIVYAYRAKVMPLIVGLALFSACAVAAGGGALENDRGLLVNGIVLFGPAAATAFYWFLFGFSCMLVGLSGLVIVRSLFWPSYLVFDGDGLIVPFGFLQRKTVRIAYSAITHIIEERGFGQISLVVSHEGSKTRILRGMLPSIDAYNSVGSLLRRH